MYMTWIRGQFENHSYFGDGDLEHLIGMDKILEVVVGEITAAGNTFAEACSLKKNVGFRALLWPLL